MAHALGVHNKVQIEESKKIKINTVMIDIAEFEVGAVDRARTPPWSSDAQRRIA